MKFPLRVSLGNKGEWNQYIAGCIAGLSYGCCGIAYAWVNPIMLAVMSTRSTITMTLRQVSWTASLPQLAAILSPFVFGYLADKIGRKTLLLMTAPVQVATWVIIAFTSNFIIVCIVRSIQGIVMGGVQTVLPMYLGEIADSNSRGKVSVLYSLGWNLGLLYEFSLGPFVKINQLDWLNAVPPTGFLIIFLWFPESPYYLVMREKFEEAVESLSFFRPDGYAAKEELSLIEQNILEEKNDFSNLKDVIKKPEWRKGVTIVVIITVTFSFCGAVPVLSYCNETFEKVTGEKLFSEFVTIGVSASLTLMTVVTLFTVDIIGRRVVLIASYATSSLCLIPTAVYFYMDKVDPSEASRYYLVPVVCLVIFPSFITLGAMTIVHTYQAELFSTRTRSIGSAFVTFVSAITSVVTLETYIPLENHNEDYINFSTYSAVSIFGLIFSIIVAPETKGYDLEEAHKTL